MSYKRQAPIQRQKPEIMARNIEAELDKFATEYNRQMEALSPVAGGPVTSFNGRVGTVLPVLGDYNSFFLTPAEGAAAYDAIGSAAAAQAAAIAAAAAADIYYGSTGVLTGGAISIGTGGAGVATTFTIAAGTGKVIDNTVNPPTSTAVTWSAKTNVAVTNIGTQLVTYVGLDSGGNVIQSATDFTPSQLRDYIVIGVVVHSNLTTVNAVNQQQGVAYNPGNQLQDLTYALKIFNIEGNVFTANGANLSLNKSSGFAFRQGANYSSLTDNPHVVTLASLVAAPLRMQNQTGAGSATTTFIDPSNYDLAGTTTAVPANKFTVLRIFSFVSNLVAVQRGQAVYNSLAEAKAGVQSETYVTNAILAANGLLRGFLIVRQGTTSLSSATNAFFLEAPKFGGASGVGGLSVSTLQNVYDNSADPEMLTDATRGALTIKRGSGADTDTVIEAMNNAGSVTASITGAGVITGSNLSGTNTGDQTLYNQTVEDEGTPVTQRSTVNFVGAGVSVADAGGKTTVTIAGASGTGDVVGPASAVDNRIAVFDSTTGKLIKQSTLTVADLQPIDADLTAIAALSPTNDDIIQRKSGAWTNRTMTQLRTDLDLGWQLIYDHTVSGGAVTSVATGAILNGDVDEVYRIFGYVIAAGAANFDVQLNGDTGGNYYYQYILGAGTAVTGARGATYTRLAGSNTGGADVAVLDITLYAKSGQKRPGLVSANRGTGATGGFWALSAGWNNTADNITSATLVADAASAISNGSRFMIWKKSA